MSARGGSAKKQNAGMSSSGVVAHINFKPRVAQEFLKQDSFMRAPLTKLAAYTMERLKQRDELRRQSYLDRDFFKAYDGQYKDTDSFIDMRAVLGNAAKLPLNVNEKIHNDLYEAIDKLTINSKAFAKHVGSYEATLDDLVLDRDNLAQMFDQTRIVLKDTSISNCDFVSNFLLGLNGFVKSMSDPDKIQLKLKPFESVPVNSYINTELRKLCQNYGKHSVESATLIFHQSVCIAAARMCRLFDIESETQSCLTKVNNARCAICHTSNDICNDVRSVVQNIADYIASDAEMRYDKRAGTGLQDRFRGPPRPGVK